MNPRNLNPRYFRFFVSFLLKTIFSPPRYTVTLISKDMEFYCASSDLYEKFTRGYPPIQTPTQKLKFVFRINSKIWKAPQSELCRIKFYSLVSKILQNPGIQPKFDFLEALSHSKISLLDFILQQVFNTIIHLEFH